MTVWSSTLTALADGQEITGEVLGEYHDSLAAITDPWTDYSGSLAWTGAVTNPVIGNGTIAARYLQVGKFVLYTVSITMGSTTTYGSSTWFVSLPVTPIASAVGNTTCPGSALLYDSSATAGRQSGTASIFSTTQVDFYIGSGGVVTSLAPFTWTTGDILGLTLQYEAA